jgi:CheY-like chemotaxis protein
VLLLSAGRREEISATTNAFAQLIKPVRSRKLRLALENALSPHQAAAPAPATPATDEVPHGRRLRVLVAEDNATNQRIVRTHLEAWGHIVVGASDGSEAVERLAREPFDLVFMDLQMPKMDGIATTLAIRKKETNDEHIPIVALTANVLKGVREECLAAGMDGYLGKPVREHELLSTIESVIPGLRPVAHTQVTPPAAVPRQSATAQLPFDASELLARVNGNLGTIADLLRDSRDEDLPGLVTTLSEALASVDCDKIRRSAHAIKGVVGVFHAPAAYAAAKQLEDSAREEKTERLADQTAELLRTVFDLLTNLERFLAAPVAHAA